MYRLIRLLRTSIGSKLIMAASGGVLVLFLLGHMLGNLAVFQGPAALNAYAAWLQGNPLLWAIRLTLLGIFAWHVYTGVRLWRENRAARPQHYAVTASVQAGIAARSMGWTGLALFAFLIFHLLHLTFGALDSAHAHLLDGQHRPDVYARVVLGFRNPWLAGAYVAGLLVVGLHLDHAIASLLQTLGVGNENYRPLLRVLARALAGLIVFGFIAIPLAALFGLLGATTIVSS